MIRETRTALRVIAPWGHDTGFRLGGAPVTSVADEQGLQAELDKVLGQGGLAVLAIPSSMKDWVSKKHLKKIEKEVFPLVVYYAYPEKWEVPEEADEAIAEIVQRAIGYRLRIKF